MSFGSRLRDKRKELGITQPELAEKLGVSQSAIGSWETDVNSPRATLLYDLFDILQCDANYLFQDEAKQLYKDEASPEEFEKLVKKYRELDSHGKDMVDTVLQKEYERIVSIKDSLPATEILDVDVNSKRKTQKNSTKSTDGTDNIIEIDVEKEKQKLETVASHTRTDIEASPENQQRDLDLMDDDSKWE
ncbi:MULTISPECIES: helix-turn-helix transcriptional regulator [unclassified Ruminococcus]|uniref:helix-turn-helix domain-containing protein n=1 Tax=unclassified Ruminococcus TaxID=2608920 RepID=UPI00319E4789